MKKFLLLTMAVSLMALIGCNKSENSNSKSNTGDMQQEQSRTDDQQSSDMQSDYHRPVDESAPDSSQNTAQ